MNSTKTKTEYATSNNKTLAYDWGKIYSENYINQVDFEFFIKDSRNKIAEELIEFVKKKVIVQDLLRRCQTQNTLNNVIFSSDDVWGEIHLVITAVLDRWESVCRAEMESRASKSKRKLKHASIDGDLRMHTYNDIIGYFRCALRNAFADLFTHHSAQKRAANEVTFSNMLSKDADGEDDRLFEDTLANSDHSDLMFRAYRSDMIRYLRHHDLEKGTKLARMFVSLINPKNNGAVIKIQEKLGISNKVFNEQREEICEVLNKEFGELSHEIISYFEKKRHAFSDLESGNKAARKFKNRKTQEAEDDKSRPYRMNVVFGQKSNPEEPNKPIYYASVMIDRSKTKNIVAYSVDNWERVYNHEEKLVGKPGQLDKIKPKLEKLISPHLAEANILLSQLKEGKIYKIPKKSSKSKGL